MDYTALDDSQLQALAACHETEEDLEALDRNGLLFLLADLADLFGDDQ